MRGRIRHAESTWDFEADSGDPGSNRLGRRQKAAFEEVEGGKQRGKGETLHARLAICSGSEQER